MTYFLFLALASITTIAILMFCIYRIVLFYRNKIEALKRKHRQLINERIMKHDREMISFRKSSEQEFMDKLAFIERSNPDRFIVHKDIRVPVMSIPVRYSEPVMRHHFGSMSMDSFVPVQRPEGNCFEAKRIDVCYLDERMRTEVIKREIARNIADWMVKNGFVFGEFYRDRNEVKFGFYYYTKN